MLRCDEVTRLHATDAIRTAGWRTRLSARIHLLMCRSCRRYVRELAAIGDAVRGLLNDAPDDAESSEALLRRVFPEKDDPDR